MNFIETHAGRQRRGLLWSTAQEVCDLLSIGKSLTNGSEQMLFQHVQIKAGQRFCRIGKECHTLYVVKSGFLKTVMIDELGNEQVLSFPMKGDLLGLDGIDSCEYTSEAVALSDCDLILLPITKLASFSDLQCETENSLYRLMSRELVRRQGIIGMLGSLSAEARVARFLIELSGRFLVMGYSSRLFNLRMTRHDIGSYLGLTLETVSRTLSAFNEIGLITVDQRCVGINDPESLKNLRRLPPSRSRLRRPVAHYIVQFPGSPVSGNALR